ncbi:hypothetical protein QBC46DRAFT_388832 [Diplogelasinospora grovesii]|uniref:Uncharacterized protein n=1 Tax=Diplogelasinospora grovesii TaxID=303347 RepID=A0AAN6N5U6_9PEZI|nr:hypothetical protein QBC46DRAFT_388832 [Diplogelasinospora grovesii]
MIGYELQVKSVTIRGAQQTAKPRRLLRRLRESWGFSSKGPLWGPDWPPRFAPQSVRAHASRQERNHIAIELADLPTGASHSPTSDVAGGVSFSHQHLGVSPPSQNPGADFLFQHEDPNLPASSHHQSQCTAPFRIAICPKAMEISRELRHIGGWSAHGLGRRRRLQTGWGAGLDGGRPVRRRDEQTGRGMSQRGSEAQDIHMRPTFPDLLDLFLCWLSLVGSLAHVI